MSKLLAFALGIGTFLALSSLIISPGRSDAADPACVGLPDSGMTTQDTAIGPGTSPYLGTWWGSWAPGTGISPSFFLVRAVSGYDVDATYVATGVVQPDSIVWRHESDGHIGANSEPLQTSFVWNVNAAGNLLTGTRYYQGNPDGTIVMSRCTVV